MAAVPLYLSVATIIYSVLFPPEQKECAAPSRTMVACSSTIGKNSFMYGVAVGMSLSTLISIELRRRRVPERMRLALYTWLYDSKDSRENSMINKLRKPVKVMELDGDILSSTVPGEADGVRRDLLSPMTALTSSLHVVLLTIPSGTELIAQKACGVEFYYVVTGNGYYRTGETQTEISKGDGFVVDPGTFRAIAGRGRSDLILLRATDAPKSSKKGYDLTQLDPKNKSKTMSMLSTGLGKMETMVNAYIVKPESQDSAEF